MMHGLCSRFKRIVYTYPRTDYQRLARRAEFFDTISFDVFDTALRRKCGPPEQIFSIIETKYDVDGFRHKRIAAEKTARSLHGKATNIQHIYQEYPASEARREFLCNVELEEEANNLVAKQGVYGVFQHALGLGKNILFVSDMYLSSVFIAKLLKREGYGNPIVVVSNEEGQEKEDGQLFRVALERLTLQGVNVGKAMHIGDSFKPDYLGPRKVGLSSALIKRYVAFGLSESTHEAN